MKFQSARIKDISKEVGFSPSTVSRALRDSHEISEETKKIILACANKLHYRPNPMAQGLRSKQSHTLAIFISDISNSFFSQVVSGVESVAAQHGYNIIILQNNNLSQSKILDIQYLTSSIDGLLISVSSESGNNDLVRSLHERGLPIVLFDRIVSEIDTHTITLNNNSAAYIATKHLAAQGYNRIAAIINADHALKAKDRVAGYKKAMDDCYLTCKPEWIRLCKENPVSQAEIDYEVSELLNMPNRPHAIVALDDHITRCVIKALQLQQVKVPDEMAMVGLSNSDFYELLSPPLSIIRQPAKEMGEQATQLLIKLIKSKRPPKEFVHQVLEPQLIFRKSSQK